MKRMKPPKWARTRAASIAKSPEKLHELIRRAQAKADEHAKNDDSGSSGERKQHSSPLRDVFDYLMDMLALLIATAQGKFRPRPDHLILIIAAVLYWIVPIDLIPDFIPGLGYIDDAAVIVWVIRSCKTEIDRFRDWRDRQTGE